MLMTYIFLKNNNLISYVLKEVKRMCTSLYFIGEKVIPPYFLIAFRAQHESQPTQQNGKPPTFLKMIFNQGNWHGGILCAFHQRHRKSVFSLW